MCLPHFLQSNFGIFQLGFYSARMNQSFPRDTLIYSGIVTASHTYTFKLDQLLELRFNSRKVILRH